MFGRASGSLKFSLVFLFALIASSPFALEACSGGPAPAEGGSGGARVGLSFPEGYTYDSTTHMLYPPSGRANAVLPGYVTGMTLTITGEDMDTQVIAVNLSTLEVSFVISPGIRTFTIVVTTSIGLTFSDSITIEVFSGKPLFLSFSLLINAPPQINAISVNPSVAAPGQVVALSCSASDPDETDTLTYSWTGPGGFSASGPTAEFTIPGYGVFGFTCHVSDDRGLGTEASVSAVAPKPNSPPVITSLTGKMISVMVDLSCQAYDPDGDTLTYSWTAQVNYLNPPLPGPPAVCTPANTPITQCPWLGVSLYTCTVSDGKNSVSSSIAL
ncbi:MAG: PKD domain-containing protein [Nitrospinota bacterium]|nr:PKD domain-containing protein [Nitrospinota bacterium]